MVSTLQDEPTSVDEALAIIHHTNERWLALTSGQAMHDEGFWLGEDAAPAEANADGAW